MSAHAFAATGTLWWIDSDQPELNTLAEGWVRDAEARLSRFRPDSALSRLNTTGVAEDALLAQIVTEGLMWEHATEGAFSIKLGRELCALGYDRDLARVVGGLPTARPSATDVVVDGDVVRVRSVGEPAWIDLGGIAKGWVVDRVHDRLRRAGATWALVDGGGDLRGSGRPWPIGVGDDATILDDGGIATSSTLERRWTDLTGAPRHHVLDPATGLPADGPIVTATVRAPTALVADVLATAMLVAPQRVLLRLPALRAAAWVRDHRGHTWTTPDWEPA